LISHKHKVAAVIPAYNEASTIGVVVESACSFVQEVIVVDDCSKDDTEARAKAAGATVVRSEINKGYDTSVDIGMREALARGADIIVTLDADGQHKAEDIPRLISPIMAGEADVVLTQRPKLAHPAEKLFAWYTRHKFGIDDPLCGMKAYRRQVYERFGPFDSLQSIGTELMARAKIGGMNITVVPVEIRERADVSRFYYRRLRGNLRILEAMWRVMWHVGLRARP
jgi:glycosyltransferase involved in cell wall biosynthesis